MTVDEVRAIFLLAGYKVRTTHATLNGYSSTREDPWWLVSTDHGLFHIGWRRHVISIDWTDIGAQPSPTSDDVTKNHYGVHAYSYAKAVEYLDRLRRESLDRLTSLKTMLVTPEIVKEAEARFEAEIEQQKTDPNSGQKWSRDYWIGLFETERAVWIHRVLADQKQAA